MPANKESYIEAQVSEHAQSRGWLAFKWAAPSRRGVPDRIYFKNGQVKLIEFKSPGRSATKQQIFTHCKLEKMGFHVHIVDNIKHGKSLFA